MMTPSDVKATLSFSDGSPSMELPLYKGSVGPDVIDIRKLYGQTGKFTYDPGFLSTASCNSTITYIDGDKGELLYRGYPIEQLAHRMHSYRPLSSSRSSGDCRRSLSGGRVSLTR